MNRGPSATCFPDGPRGRRRGPRRYRLRHDLGRIARLVSPARPARRSRRGSLHRADGRFPAALSGIEIFTMGCARGRSESLEGPPESPEASLRSDYGDDVAGQEPGSEFLRLAEAARLLGIGDTTLKRWTEEGRIRCSRTSGGHRRFLRVDVEACRTHVGSPVLPTPIAPSPVRAPVSDGRAWIDDVIRPIESNEMASRVHAIRARSRDWAETGDRICAELLAEIGKRWESHGPSCAEEHSMSRSIESVFVAASRAMQVPPGAPSMLLACIAGERHTLGLSFVEAAV